VTASTPYPQYLERTHLWQSIAKNAYGFLDFEQLLHIYQAIYLHDEVPIAWLPDNYTLSHANITGFMQTNNLKTYPELYQWSVQHRDWFWASAILQLGIQLEEPYTSILDLSEGPENPIWLAEARMNIVDSCFKSLSDKTAIMAADESGNIQSISYGELQKLTRQVASGLTKLGMKSKDRIILYLPLCPEAVASYLGIIMAGMSAVLVADSFSVTELKNRASMSNASLVITVDGYLYGGKPLHIYKKVKEAGITQSVVIPLLKTEELNAEDIPWEDFLEDEDFSSYIADPHDTTSILFSSGTTKEPKAIPWTHLTPIKCASDAYFHHDVHPQDIITWTTGMGWMMGPWLPARGRERR
jgi:acetyl-CoA synthetase